jgi:hypothetical protein
LSEETKEKLIKPSFNFVLFPKQTDLPAPFLNVINQVISILYLQQGCSYTLDNIGDRIVNSEKRNHLLA